MTTEQAIERAATIIDPIAFAVGGPGSIYHPDTLKDAREMAREKAREIFKLCVAKLTE
jgi:hypothetical protein